MMRPLGYAEAVENEGGLMLISRVLADAIVVFHAAYVSFVVLGLPIILIGIGLKRGWVRNFWFRAIHLGMIGVVVLETMLGIPCPLTVWEHQLRLAAGEQSYRGDFLGYWAHRLIFVDAPPWAFNLIYTLFGLAVLLTFILAPPRLPGRSTGIVKTH
jgi:hypothetical protein